MVAKVRPVTAPAMQRLASELGYVSIYWSWMEHMVDDLIAQLAHLDDPDVALSVVANAEQRNKIQMAKALAFLRKPDDYWFEQTLALLDYIDNDIRARRNRYIHAGWDVPAGRLLLHIRKTKLRKPQAFQLELSTFEEATVKIAEIRKLAKEMLRALVNFVFILSFAMHCRDGERDALPSMSFRQFIRRLKLVPRRKGRPPGRGSPRQSFRPLRKR